MLRANCTGQSGSGIFLHPLRGVDTPTFYVHPDQFELVTPVEVKSWTDAEAAPDIY